MRIARFFTSVLLAVLVFLMIPVQDAKAETDNATVTYSGDNSVLEKHDKSFFFGRYPGTENGENRAILWRVVKKKGNNWLLVSFYALDVLPVDKDQNSDFHDTSLYKWLNSDFLNQAFSPEEQSHITSSVDILELSEFSNYYRDVPEGEDFFYSDYARHIDKKNDAVWLSTPSDKKNEYYVVDGGKIKTLNSAKSAGVCPAIWIDVSEGITAFPYMRYYEACDLADSGEYLAAAELFDALGDEMSGSWIAADVLFDYVKAAIDVEDYFEAFDRFFLYDDYCNEKDVVVTDEAVEVFYELAYQCATQAKQLGDQASGLATSIEAHDHYMYAIGLYEMLGNYKDSMKKLLECYDSAEVRYHVFDIDPVNAGNKTGYGQSDRIDNKDPHSGWKLGRFILRGFSSEEIVNGKSVFTRSMENDTLTLIFELQQDIYELNGDSKLYIDYDEKAEDTVFNYNEKDAQFGEGTLLIRRTDPNGKRDPIHPYKDYLAALYYGLLESDVEINQEGGYEIALDYLVTRDALKNTTNGYRMSFEFEVKNGDSVVFLNDSVTGAELQDYSVTDNGFILSTIGSSTVSMQVTRYGISVNGNALDIRASEPASSGARFDQAGYYIIEMTNQVTGKTVEKHLFVHKDNKLEDYIQIDPSLQSFVESN